MRITLLFFFFWFLRWNTTQTCSWQVLWNSPRNISKLINDNLILNHLCFRDSSPSRFEIKPELGQSFSVGTGPPFNLSYQVSPRIQTSFTSYSPAFEQNQYLLRCFVDPEPGHVSRTWASLDVKRLHCDQKRKRAPAPLRLGYWSGAVFSIEQKFRFELIIFQPQTTNFVFKETVDLKLNIV